MAVQTTQKQKPVHRNKQSFTKHNQQTSMHTSVKV